jgi:hypothetical protein
VALNPLRRVPWIVVLSVAKVVWERFRNDVKPKDRQELGRIVRKSKGDPRRLTDRERQELLRIVKGIQVSQLRDDVVEQVAPFGTKRLLRRR